MNRALGEFIYKPGEREFIYIYIYKKTGISLVLNLEVFSLEILQKQGNV